MAVWIPAAAAYDSCALLEARRFNYIRGSSSEDPLKPKNVTARGNDPGTSFNVSWDIPSSRPASTVTGHYVHFTHEASGESKEYERSGSGTSFAAPMCVTGRHCTGTFQIEVMLKNDCGVTEGYSDSISYDLAY